MPKAKQSLNDLLYEVKRIEEHRATLSESKVRKIYKQLMKELNAFVAEEYVKYADADGVLTFSTLRDRSRQARFIEEVAAKVDSITPELHGEIMGLCEKTYKSCYEGMGKAVRSASNTEELAKVVKGGLVTPDVVKQSFDNSISKLTLPNALEKHRQEVIYTVKQELSIGLINGDRYEKMARRLTDKLDISYGKATRIVRTESHRNIESGFFDCAERLADKMEGSGLVSVCTWRTMKDERVRPNVRRKTKKGWKTYKSKNGADHVAMEGKTVRVGDFFVFPDGVKTKAPSKSGEARHDCNCRCFLEYDVMTEEEFAKVNANKTEKTKTVSDNTDTGEKEDLTERRRQRLAQRDKKGEKQVETVITPEYIQEKHGVAVDISAAGKNGAEAQRSLEHLDRLLTEYDSTMVSYSVVPSVFGSEGGSAYMLNGKTAVQVQGKALRVVRATDELGLGENQPLGVTYHEFAHTLTQSREKMTPEFWKEIRQAHREYKKAIYDEGKTELRISLYADKDVDEFFAEAFTQAKLSEDASPYAKKVLEITDKHFKKPVAKSTEKSIIKTEAKVEKPVDLSLSNLEQFEKWQNGYYEANKGVSFAKADNPTINRYSGGAYEAINAIERGGSSLKKAKRCYGEKYIESMKGVGDKLSDELSKFTLHTPLSLRRSVGNVDYITGATSSVDDMKKMIGKTFTEKGFTSTTVCTDTLLPFGGCSETQTILYIDVPKGTKGAYIYKMSDSPAEFEFLIDRNATFKIVDAGEREITYKDYKGRLKKKKERFMKLRLVKQ